MPHPPIDVLLEDNHLLAVDKPAGVGVQPDDSGDEPLLELARSYIKQKYAKPGRVYLAPAHRLDRPVSGALLFARTDKAASRLAEAFRARRVEKEYNALVEWPSAAPLAGAEGADVDAKKAADADTPTAAPSTLLRDWLLPGKDGANTRVLDRDAPGAKRAELAYRVLRVFPAADALEDDGVGGARGPNAGGSKRLRAWLAVFPRTGYKHQIRAQLAWAGMPVVGDFRYGPRGRPARPARFMDGRAIALHAVRLRFAHPTRKDTVEVEAPIPPPLAALAAPAKIKRRG